MLCALNNNGDRPEYILSDTNVDELPHEGRVVARIGPSGFRTTIDAGGHALVSDEPREVGGTDEGATPYDLILAALGACTAITLRMYADRKGWPLDDVTVRLSHGRSHAADEEQCENRPVRLDQIERTLELSGPLTHDQRVRLAEIAERCPVHRTLDAGVRITTRLSAEGAVVDSSSAAG
jgi:putative redox protein